MATANDDAEATCSTRLSKEDSLKEPTSPTESTKPKKASVQIKDPPVTETRGYTVVRVEEKHGIFHNAIPVMPLPLAILLCLLNIVVPGTGTLFSAAACLCCPSRLSSRAKSIAINLLSAILQMLTFLVIVGWIWSILWGMTMVQLSLASSRKAKNVNLPYYVRRQSSVE